MICTNRTTLRAIETTDLALLYLYRNDEEIKDWLVGFSPHMSHADLEEWLESHRKRSDEILWAITVGHPDRCIGYVGLYTIDQRVRKAELGILVGEKASQGQGIGEEVCRAVIGYAFHELCLHKVSIAVLATNHRALRLYERLSFRRDGALRDEQFRHGAYVDVLLLSVLESEWT